MSEIKMSPTLYAIMEVDGTVYKVSAISSEGYSLAFLPTNTKQATILSFVHVANLEAFDVPLHPVTLSQYEAFVNSHPEAFFISATANKFINPRFLYRDSVKNSMVDDYFFAVALHKMMVDTINNGSSELKFIIDVSDRVTNLLVRMGVPYVVEYASEEIEYIIEAAGESRNAILEWVIPVNFNINELPMQRDSAEDENFRSMFSDDDWEGLFK